MQVVWVRSLVRKLRSHRPLTQKSQNVKQKQYCNKFDKDFEKLVYIRKILKKNKEYVYLKKKEEEAPKADCMRDGSKDNLNTRKLFQEGRARGLWASH